MKVGENNLEVCKLEFASPGRGLQTVCFLELPPLASDSSLAFHAAYTEWVPTSKDYARSRTARGYHVPFYSSTVHTIGLLLDYYKKSEESHHPRRYAMIISVPRLLSAIQTDVRNVPWADWGPSSTHVFETTSSRPLGPLWITELSPEAPLVVRRYNIRRTRRTQSMTGDASSLQTPAPVITSTEVFGDHRETDQVETHLPYRDVRRRQVDFRHFVDMTADREWVIEIAKASVRGFCVYIIGPVLWEPNHAL